MPLRRTLAINMFAYRQFFDDTNKATVGVVMDDDGNAVVVRGNWRTTVNVTNGRPPLEAVD